ncbi:MAG: nitrous oxide reductase family maturation protein NosD, partial [Saprospiraceae bacterium]|nr:nitrous oxide reductase family maturation protein NosD [Bacteroidia bacterium]NNL93587.1 nitrous oxide reductase family maturation protein NosD [Saprospiraceae bacterium]
CETNEITENNFLYNTMDLVVSTQLNDNRIYHNYWSEYTGYDLDYDDLGDIPHFPVKLFSYIVNDVPESIVLMRSLFVDIINFSEKVSPVFTPKDVADNTPSMVIFENKADDYK